MNRQQILGRLDRAWTELAHSYSQLTEAQLLEAGVTGTWSVKDILAHVTSWEREALTHLPGILAGRRPPRYSVLYGGIDAFNARMTEHSRALSLGQVLEELEGVHQELIRYIGTVPEEQFTRDTRFRRRLRLDTYSHYPKHAKAISQWRAHRGV